MNNQVQTRMAAIEFERFSRAPSAQVCCHKLTDDTGRPSGIARRGRFVGGGFEEERYRIRRLQN